MMVVSQEFFEKFKEVAKPLELNRKDFLVKEGQVAPYLGIVEEGGLYAYLINRNGDQQVNSLFYPGTVVTSYRSFLTQKPSVGYIQAYTNCKLYVITFGEYSSLQEDSYWIKAFKEIGDGLFIEKCMLQTSLATLDAKDRYEEFHSKHSDVEEIFPQHLLASYLNIRPETLSRIKSLDLGQVVL